jgi:hypothetical protein
MITQVGVSLQKKAERGIVVSPTIKFGSKEPKNRLKTNPLTVLCSYVLC